MTQRQRLQYDQSYIHLGFLLPLLGSALQTVAVGAVTSLATNAVQKFIAGDRPTAGARQETPTASYEEVAGGDAEELEPVGVPFEEEALTPEEMRGFETQELLPEELQGFEALASPTTILQGVPEIAIPLEVSPRQRLYSSPAALTNPRYGIPRGLREF